MVFRPWIPYSEYTSGLDVGHAHVGMHVGHAGRRGVKPKRNLWRAHGHGIRLEHAGSLCADLVNLVMRGFGPSTVVHGICSNILCFQFSTKTHAEIATFHMFVWDLHRWVLVPFSTTTVFQPQLLLSHFGAPFTNNRSTHIIKLILSNANPTWFDPLQELKGWNWKQPQFCMKSSENSPAAPTFFQSHV